MKKYKKLISFIVVISLVISAIPLYSNLKVAYGEPANLTNSSTVVDLDELKNIIDDDTDSNEDGLPDQLKRILGLDPLLEDTNNDGISDKFKLDNGLDPLKQDTYDIGISDFYALTKGDEEKSLTSDLLTEDMDEDGTFDIEDIDIDGDRVNNAVDLSPFSHLDAKESHLLEIKTSGKTSGVTLQLQPADLSSMMKNSRVMTWPIDIDGQMSNFNATEDNVKIVPMLEVDMDEYTDQEVLDEWNYLMFEDQLYIPLQLVEDDYQPVALEAYIHLPEEFGTLNSSENKYEIELEVKLSWLMVGQTYNVTQQWEPFAKVQSLHEYQVPVMGDSLGLVFEDREEWRDIRVEDIDEQNNKEYLSSSIANLNDNDIPDLAIYWVENNSVYEKKYYDLEYDENLEVYRALSEDDPQYVYQSFEFANKKQERIESETDSNYKRVHNSKYIVNRDRDIRNTAYYYVNDSNNTLEVIANENNSSAGPEKELTIDNHGFYTINQEYGIPSIFSAMLTDPRKYSYLRDAVYKSIPDERYPTNHGSVWYLYEMYNQSTGYNEIVLSLDHSEIDSSKNILQREVLIDDIDPDSTKRIDRRKFRDLESGLSVNIYDFDHDDYQDLMFTDRQGRTFIILDIYGGSNWKDRMHQIRDNREIEDVHGQNTLLFDLDRDGEDELVGIQAYREEMNYGPNLSSTDLTFQISKKPNIKSTLEILMKDYEAFAITGMKVEEHQGVETRLITGENTEELLYMASMLYSWYLKSDYSIEEVINEYVETVMEDDRSNLEEVSNNYAHTFEALLDIGKEIDENETWKSFDGPKPLLILTEEDNRVLTLDDVEEKNSGGITSIDISERDIIKSKQLIVKWIDNSRTLSSEEISDLVDKNPEELDEFTEDPQGNKDALNELNIGVTDIVAIGDETIEAEPISAFKEALQEWRTVWVIGKGNKYGVPIISKMIGTNLLPKMGIKTFLPPNALLQPNNSVFRTKLSKYKSVMGKVNALGKVVKGTGTLVDVGLAVYSGYLYGEAMAQVGGTTFGAVTGVTYGNLMLATSIITAKLVALGPVGWVVLGALVSDTIIALFIEGYEGIVAMSFSVAMSMLFDAKLYPGTKINSIKKSKEEDVNKRIYTGTDFGFKMGSEIEDINLYHIDLVGASYSSPANSQDGLKDSWSDLSIYNESNLIDTDNNKIKSRDDVVKEGSYWHRYIDWEFRNKLAFNKAGINLAADNRTALYYRLIESVKYTRYLWYEKTELDYARNTVRSKSVSYYDVMPESLEMFWEFFDFINWDENPSHEFPREDLNQLAYRDPYYDSNNDGIPDRIKEELGLDVSLSDTDGDGVSDYDELKLGTDPLVVDTDGDGVNDNIEINEPVNLEIITSNGSVEAWGYSDPLKEDTSGDGYDDQRKTNDELNPASMHTHGSVLFDYNDNAPELIQDFEDQAIIDLDTVEFILEDYVFDQEDAFEDLDFSISHGELKENEEKKLVWEYQLDMAEDGRYVELSLEVNDLRGGILETEFLVYDETRPVVEQVSAKYDGADDGADDGAIVDPENLQEFLQPLVANPMFATRFNKPINYKAISEGAIYIEPTGERAILDTDDNLVRHSTATAIELIKGTNYEEIGITRIDPIVEDGIEYKLHILGNAIRDRYDDDPLYMETDFNISFSTEDNEPPKIKDVRYGLDGSGTTWDLNNPLVIEFNEEIVLADEQYYSLFSSQDPYRRKFTMLDKAAEIDPSEDGYVSAGEGHLLMNLIDNKTIMVEVEPNYLKNATTYTLYHRSGNSENYDLRDPVGNLFNSDYLGGNLPEFITGDVRGPKIIAERNRGFRADEQGYDNYEVDIQANGEIHINFDEPINPGDRYDDIVLTYGNSIHLWMHEIMLNEVKDVNLPHEKWIEHNKLIIKPQVPFAEQKEYMSYVVYIPSKALTDSTGNTIFEESRYSDSNTHYSSDYNDFTQVVRARANSNHEFDLYPVVVDHVAVPQEWGHASILRAMIDYPTTENNVVEPGKTLMAVLSDRVNSLNTEDISLWKLDNQGNEIKEIIHTPAYTPGSNIVLITPLEKLEIDTDYKVKFAESELVIDLEAQEDMTYDGNTIPEGAEIKYTINNPASESIFTVSESERDKQFSGGNDMNIDSFVGMTRVDEVVALKGNIKRYYDMFNNRFNRKEDLFTYQWLIGDTTSSGDAVPITGENNILYIPKAEDEGRYLFFRLEVNYEGLDSHIPEELRFGYDNFSITSPALGPIMPAYKINNSLEDIIISDIDNEDQNLLVGFDNNTDDYNITVAPNVKTVRVNPQYNEAFNSFVSINGINSDLWKDREDQGQLLEDGLEIPLELGDNDINILSISENYLDTKVIKIKIVREAETEEAAEQFAPEARFVTIENERDFFLGKTLKGQYEFYDEYNRNELGTTYQWYRHSENNSNSREAISGATDIEYTITEDDINKYLSFEVTPRAENSIVSGEPILSWWTGPVGLINDKETSITDIKVMYEGSNILEEYNSSDKIYNINFASNQENIVEVEVVGGENVSINDMVTTSSSIDFVDNTRLIEVVADSINPGEPTSYFIQVHDEPFPYSINIEGNSEIEITDYDETIRLNASVYDQYGEIYDANIKWDTSIIPNDIDYRISGEDDTRLTINIPSDSNSFSGDIKAWVKNNEEVQTDKFLSVIGKDPIQLSDISENLSEELQPSFSGDNYDYTITAKSDEEEVQLSATLDDDTDSTIKLIFDGEEQVVTSGAISTISLNKGENTIYFEVDKEGFNSSTYTLVIDKEPKIYNVTFNDWDGSEISSQTVKEEESAIAPADPEREGYTFDSWDKDFSNVSSNLVVTAQYNINSYNVSFNTDGGSEVSNQLVEYQKSAERPATDPTKKGYIFVDWYSDQNYTSQYDFDTPIKGDTTIYAKWEVKTYQVSYDLTTTNGSISAKVDGESISSGEEVQEGKEIVFTASSDSGYQIEHWLMDGEVIPDYKGNTYIIDELMNNIEVSADFILIPDDNYQVKFNVRDKEEYIAIDGAEIVVASDILFTNTSGSAITYLQDGTYDYSVEKSQYITTSGAITVTGSAITVEVELESLDIAVTGVNIDQNNQAIDKGNEVQLSATVEPSNASNKNIRWESDNINIATVSSSGLVTGVNIGEAEIKVITEDGNYIDRILVTVEDPAQETYTITFLNHDDSVIKMESLEEGSEVSPPEDPTREGYSFSGWSQMVPEKMPAQNLELKSEWSINQYTINFDANGGSSVEPITQDYNTEIEEPSNPSRRGYRFRGWDPELPEKMPAENFEVSALWRKISKKSEPAQEDNIIIEDNEKVTKEEKEESGVRVVEIRSEKDTNDIKITIKGNYQKELEGDSAMISMRSNQLSYNIPAKQIDIANIAKQFDIDTDEYDSLEIDIEIKDVEEEQNFEIRQRAEDSEFEIVFEPISFTITARYISKNGEIIEKVVERFDNYVERVIKIPEGVDPDKVTTGVIYNEDGTFAHVPTSIYEEDGVYYAKIKSLTNSIYTLITNDIEVESVSNHWAKTPVNTLAKRLIIEALDKFNPEALITRGAFAEYITKAIGIYRNDFEIIQDFSDVEDDNEYSKAISVANEYGIISGYPDGSFKPNRSITRQEAMAMFSNAMDVIKFTGEEVLRIEQYKDKSKISSWAYESVENVIAARVFNGKTANTIAPLDTITYAEATTAIWNLLRESELIDN